jgi:hypothetical protein
LLRRGAIMSVMYHDEFQPAPAASEMMAAELARKGIVQARHVVQTQYMLREFLRKHLAKELGSKLPPGLPPAETISQPVIAAFVALQNYCEGLGLPYPDARTPADPEAAAMFIISETLARCRTLGAEVGAEIGDDYSFDDEVIEVAEYAEALARSISAVMKANGFRDPTQHAYTRAWLKRVREEETPKEND